MNMKDAFRFQNKLQTLMGTAQDILSSSRNITKVENTYLRKKVMPEAEDEVTVDQPTSEYSEHMTEIELNEKITNLLSENPTQQKQSRRPYARENRVKKDDRLLRIIQRYYIPHAGYVDCGFDSTTLLHSGKYIKYPKHSHCQRWMKRLTSKKTRRCTDLVRKGNEYRRLFDYWWTLY